jgi:hypothetical protein
LRPYLFVTKDKKDYFGPLSAFGHFASVVEKLAGPKLIVQKLDGELNGSPRPRKYLKLSVAGLWAAIRYESPMELSRARRRGAALAVYVHERRHAYRVGRGAQRPNIRCICKADDLAISHVN